MSSNRNTTIRSLRALGAAAWFGGPLMGAVTLNADEVVSDTLTAVDGCGAPPGGRQ
jgi:hypothetical protein